MMTDDYIKERFNSFDERLVRIEKSTSETREKVFNGFGDSIKHMEDKLKTLQNLVISVMIIGGLTILLTLIRIAI